MHATATATAIEAKIRSGDLRAPVKREKVTRAARKKAFEAEFAEWIHALNAHFEPRGIPGADLRPW